MMEPPDGKAGRAAQGIGRRRAERVVAAVQRLSLDHTATTKRQTTDPTCDPSAATRARASPSTRQDFYLQQSGVSFLLDDLVKRLYEERPEVPSVFIAAYWASVVAGTNVRAREFEYINGTLQNQIAFLTQVQRGLVGVDMQLEITSDDFAEIVWNHCRDVPSLLLNQASCHLVDTPEGMVIAPMHNFVTAFSACLIYNDFLTKVHEVYAELVQASRDVQSSSPRGTGRSESIASAMAADRVVARLRLIAQQSTFPIPPLGEVEAFVFQSTSFREFCSLFYLSPIIAATIRELQDAFATLGGSQSSPHL